MPAFAQLLLKRRRALSSDSFSLTCTDDIFSYLPSVPLYCRVILKNLRMVAYFKSIYSEDLKVKDFLITESVTVIGSAAIYIIP